MCVNLNKENSQGTMTLTDNKEERDYGNEKSSMHDGSCIGINYAHRFPKCFRSLHTLLGFSLCTSCHQFNCLSLYQFIQFLTCTRIPCRFTLRKWSCEVLSLQIFPVFPFDAFYIALDRRRVNQHPPKEGATSPLQCGRH